MERRQILSFASAQRHQTTQISNRYKYSLICLHRHQLTPLHHKSKQKHQKASKHRLVRRSLTSPPAAQMPLSSQLCPRFRALCMCVYKSIKKERSRRSINMCVYRVFVVLCVWLTSTSRPPFHTLFTLTVFITSITFST